MKSFSPLDEFYQSEEAQGDLEKFLTLTYGGKLFLEAMRYWALHVGGAQVGTVQDGARAACDQIVVLTLSGQKEKKMNADGSLKGSERPKDEKRPPVLKKELNRKPPPRPSLRGNPDLAKVPPVVGPTPPKP